MSLLAVGALVALKLLAVPNGPVLQPKPAITSVVEGKIPFPEPARSAPSPAAGLVLFPQTGDINSPLPTGIALSHGSRGETVTLLGLLDGFELSLGIPEGPGTWRLSARDLGQAFVGPTKDFVGSIEIIVQLHSASGHLLDNQPIRYEWLPKPEANSREEQETTEALRVDPAPTVQPHPRDPAEIAMLINQGEALLRNGDVASARLLLKRAAVGGSAQAALELGMTFDAEFLKRQRVVGVDPDESQARDWYEHASKLGSAEASLVLKRLAGETASDGLRLQP